VAVARGLDVAVPRGRDVAVEPGRAVAVARAGGLVGVAVPPVQLPCWLHQLSTLGAYPGQFAPRGPAVSVYVTPP
jgi:hypothetical protein